ncbi:MAG: exo-alpha-sialidase, partial [Leptospiraceae bacterium]|nr:exo-alpha-sialidase [Leptospiraceae bacterium]
ISSDDGSTWMHSVVSSAPTGKIDLNIANGYIYATRSQISALAVHYSNDDGQSWTYKPVTTGAPSFSAVPAGAAATTFTGGVILVVYSDSNDHYLKSAKSNDGGDTWTFQTIWTDGEAGNVNLISAGASVFVTLIDSGPFNAVGLFGLTNDSGSSWSSFTNLDNSQRPDDLVFDGSEVAVSWAVSNGAPFFGVNDFSPNSWDRRGTGLGSISPAVGTSIAVGASSGKFYFTAATNDGLWVSIP